MIMWTNNFSLTIIVVHGLCATRMEKAEASALCPIKLPKQVCGVTLLIDNDLHSRNSANAGLRAMNGATVGTKQLIVRLHEPKQLRQEKLAQRYGHPRTRSGATSPTVSEFGESSFTGFGSPHTKSGSLPLSNLGEGRDRGRRGSGSYFNVSPTRITKKTSILRFDRRHSRVRLTCPCSMMTLQLFLLW